MVNNNEDDNEHQEEQFVTVVADGVYTRFLEGFVSLLFYLDKVHPVYSQGTQEGQKFTTSRQTLFDVRLSINALKLLIKELNKGLDFYTGTGLISKNRDFWMGAMQYEPSKELSFHSTEEVEKLQDDALMGSFIQTMDGISNCCTYRHR